MAWPGIVFGGLEAVDPEVPLLFELVRREGRVREHGRGDLEQPGEMLGQAVGVDLGVFLGRADAEARPHEVEGFGHGVRVHLRRPLHQQGGGHSGDALGRGRFGGRAGAADEHPEADEGHVGVPEMIDREAVLEDQLLGRRQLTGGLEGQGRRGGRDGQDEGQDRPGGASHCAPPSGMSLPTVLFRSTRYFPAASLILSILTAA